MFKGLFETNEKGIIIFLRPPTGKYTSMEIYMFLVNVMVHQHLGAACSHVDDLIKDAKLTINEAKKIIDEMKLLKKSNQS